MLADRGRWIAAESTFYRVLRAAGQLQHRGRSRAPSHQRPEPLQATAANQLWSWDTTYLRTAVQGAFFYLYLIVDVFSRKIVGWEVFETEAAEQAASMLHKAHLREGIQGRDLVLHADNGAPMKGATMLATLKRLGVVPSFSRPGVSDDNSFSEALFKTLKYCPDFPSQPFADLDDARAWVRTFVQWYNEVHHRSALKFVTPAQRHRGEDADILARPQALRCRPRSPPRALERADPRLAPARCRPAQPGTCRENRDRRHANGSLIFATSSLTATEIKDAPRVRLEDKLEVERLGSGFFAAVLRLGYMERPRFDTILDLLSQTADPPSAEHPSLFLSRARIGTANVRAAIRWRARLYAFMQRNTPSPDFLLDAPSEQLIEIGVHYEL